MGYARLLRLSNAPTAVADVWMGHAVATGYLEPSRFVVLASCATLCLYSGGMAMNDWVDADRDAADGRGRPIAQGLVSRRAAGRLTAWLLALGVGFALLAHPLAGVVAIGLVAAIAAYNSALKRTPLGPLLMGLCRALNGVLGMAVELNRGAVLSVGPGVLVYTCGFTIFARDEAFGGRRGQLAAGWFVALLGLVWLTLAPYFLDGPTPLVDWLGGWLLWIVTSLMALRGMTSGLLRPTPRLIGRGVGIAIRGLLLIDVALALTYAGPPAGLAVLCLLPIASLLSTKIPST